MRNIIFAIWVLLAMLFSLDSDSLPQNRSERGEAGTLSVQKPDPGRAAPLGDPQLPQRTTAKSKIENCSQEKWYPSTSVESSLMAIGRLTGNQRDSNATRGLESARLHSDYLQKLYREKGSVAYRKRKSSHWDWWAQALSRVLADAAHLASLIDSAQVARTEERILLLSGVERILGQAGRDLANQALSREGNVIPDPSRWVVLFDGDPNNGPTCISQEWQPEAIRALVHQLTLVARVLDTSDLDLFSDLYGEPSPRIMSLSGGEKIAINAQIRKKSLPKDFYSSLSRCGSRKCEGLFRSLTAASGALQEIFLEQLRAATKTPEN